jgi:hypothetical protein
LQHHTTRVVFEWAAWCGIYMQRGRWALVARYYLSSQGIDWFHLFRYLSRSSHHVLSLLYNELRFQIHQSVRYWEIQEEEHQKHMILVGPGVMWQIPKSALNLH